MPRSRRGTLRLAAVLCMLMHDCGKPAAAIRERGRGYLASTVARRATRTACSTILAAYRDRRRIFVVSDDM